MTGKIAGWPVDGIRLQRKFRLTSSNDFKRVRRMGKSYAHPLVVLITYRNELEKSRFAVSAGRSVGNAVQRNRAKRLLREAVRPLISNIPSGWDVLLLARHPLTEVKCFEAKEAIQQLFWRAGLLKYIHDD
jgi:ribonuclease P protein component